MRDNELDPYQRTIAQYGRDPARPDWGPIDDVIDEYGDQLPYQHLITISRGRGNDPIFGNVDADTLKWRWVDYKPGQLTLISKGRGSDPDYRDISEYNPLIFCFAKMRALSHKDSRPDTNLMPYVSGSH